MEHADVNVIYSVEHQLPLVMYIGQYFFFTGLSAGSFVISVIATLLGRKEFKPIGKITALLAPALLIIAPLNLILDLEQPLRFWHLFLYLQLDFADHLRLVPADRLSDHGHHLRRHGLYQPAEGRQGPRYHGYPAGHLGSRLYRLHPGAGQGALALEHRRHADHLPGLGHGLGHRPGGHHRRDPLEVVRQESRPPSRRARTRRLILQLAQFMAYVIMLDLFLILSDILVLLTAHSDAFEAGMLILTGNFAPLFVGVEIILGSFLPMILVLGPKSRKSTDRGGGCVNPGQHRSLRHAFRHGHRRPDDSSQLSSRSRRMRNITRRDFLKLGAASTAVLAIECQFGPIA